jgi:hypothetical protein
MENIKFSIVFVRLYVMGFFGYMEENNSKKIILTDARVICNSGLREYLR